MDPTAQTDLLRQAVFVLSATVAVLLACHRVRISPLVGLLVTGVLIGPSGLELVPDREDVEVFAELGVVLLLFTIGLEVSLARLRELIGPFAVGGGVQVVTTVAVVTALAVGFGWALPVALFLGLVVSLSSTAIVLRLYDTRREMGTPQARMSLGILLFQDFMIVPMLVLIPVLAGAVANSPAAVAGRFAGSIAAIVLVYWLLSKVVPVVMHQVLRTGIRELSILVALALCLGMAWTTESLGLSLALGAFIAGLVIAETDYSHQVISEVAPFRDVFASLFFISIGMLVNLDVGLAHGPLIVGLAAVIILIKALSTGMAARLLGYPERTVVVVALGLAQVGEFAFVLMEEGHRHGLLEGTRFQIVLTAAVLTMLATPGLVSLAPRLADRWSEQRLGKAWRAGPLAPEGFEHNDTSEHVVIVGFGVNGRHLARVLREASIPYVVLDLSPTTVRTARRAGEPMIFGDSTRREILEHAGIERAQVVVFAISDTDAVRRSVRLARSMHPGIEIIVRTRLVEEIGELESCGADQVIAEEFETAIEIFTRVLERYHIPRNVIRAQTRVLRGEGYRTLRAPRLPEGVSQAVADLLALGTTDIFRAGVGTHAIGRTLRELDLSRRTGATVIALVRGETPIPGVGGDQRIEEGDDLVLVGGHAEVETAFELLERGPDPRADD